MTQHANQVIDHEDEAGHLVAKDLNPVYQANRGGAGDTMSWFCEGCSDTGQYGVLVKRDWYDHRWTSWYVA